MFTYGLVSKGGILNLKKLLQIFSIVLFVIGAGFTGYALYEIFKGEHDVNQRTDEARKYRDYWDQALDAPKSNGGSSSTEEKKPNLRDLWEFQDISDIENINFEEGKTIGLLYVPKLDKELPIIEGVDKEELAVGVGHYPGTAYPLQKEQIVLSGHRDTVFRNFDKLKIGDRFVVYLPYGKFEYEIYDTEIVHADDRTVIRPRGEEILTVTTCYPFYFLGDAPDRFIFYAKPVDTKEA